MFDKSTVKHYLDYCYGLDTLVNLELVPQLELRRFLTMGKSFHDFEAKFLLRYQLFRSTFLKLWKMANVTFQMEILKHSKVSCVTI